MRVLYDPMTALTVGSAAFSVLGGITGGIGAKNQADAEAQFYQAQAEQERLAQSRDSEALAKERDRTMARARAVLAAQGGGMEGTGQDLLQASASAFGRRELELIHDSEARIRGYDARSASARSAGSSAMWASIFSGIGAGARSSSSLFRGSPGSTTGRIDTSGRPY